MKVYEKVRAYILERGIKQTVVAERSGIHISTFNAIMNGRRTMYADDFRDICNALDVSPETFIEYKSA